MKIFVRCNITNLYVTESGWSVSMDHAKDFETIQEAERFCREHGFRGKAVFTVANMLYELPLNCGEHQET